ncbi:hypothetical protein [Dactylosporangium sp. NPDC050588]|uniref:hypothetical protein n=1 Tax=Dactylosporangium sp. NPDC050588 TaxID=3157211 RepID=UPI00340E58B4
MILFLPLRPDPLLISHTLSAPAAPAAHPPATRPASATVTAGAATMVHTRLVMVAAMTMTPVHLRPTTSPSPASSRPPPDDSVPLLALAVIPLVLMRTRT